MTEEAYAKYGFICDNFLEKACRGRPVLLNYDLTDKPQADPNQAEKSLQP